MMYIDQDNTISGPCWARNINLDHLGGGSYRNNFDVNLNYYPMFRPTLFNQFIQEYQTLLSINTILK